MAQDTLEIFCGKHAENTPNTIQFAPPLSHSIAHSSLFPKIDL